MEISANELKCLNTAFIELNTEETMEMNGGGIFLGITATLAVVGIVALTVLNPPLGLTVGTTAFKVAVASEVVGGIIVIGSAFAN